MATENALPNPGKLEWPAPSGLTVRLDDDGVTITWNGSGGIEEPEIEKLLAVIAAARAAKAGPYAPHRATREEIKDFGYQAQRERVAADLIRVIRAEVAPF